MTSGEELAQRVRAAVFPQVRWREGYRMSEVDDFLAELVAALDGGRPVAAMAEAVRFTPVRLSPGYDMGAVDTLLEEVAAGETAEIAGARARSTDDAAGATHAGERLAAYVGTAQFTPMRRGRRYSMRTVDDLLDAVREAALADRPTSGVTTSGVTTVRLGEGYDADEVDRFLAGLGVVVPRA
ncbi:hypothetical protein GCM10011519_03210 [Marmoricola endophyticus]|uniref:DivIVA domain-containing protein n=1 Tax=Marmoricola endophyticus TaxID=2040280 RepID=A0A917EYS5_9ACTN|nr:DivIVA domain-containing protein [Marmoricola endophyticus]GGF33099.1 hypothetical protein GCM10011519_03210 [Marmoricola endophyticus]